MLKKNKECLSFNLTDDSAKMVHLRINDGVPEVLHIFKQDLRSIPAAELPQRLKNFIKEGRIKNVPVICTVTPDMTITKNIEIPSLDPAEIKSIIDLQAGRHTPYSREEILIGYINCGVYQRNYSKVLLVIVTREMIKRQIDILDRAGLKIDRVLFTPEGIARFYSYALGLRQDENPFGIIHMAGTATDFIIAVRGTVIACRSFPVGMNHLAEGTGGQERFLSELKKSIESYQSEDIDKPPAMYVLTADHPRIRDLQPFLKQAISPHIKISSYTAHLKAEPGILKILNESPDDSFLNIIAPAAVEGSELDLIPDEIKMQKSIEEHGRQIVRLGILAMVALILICALFFIKIFFKSAFLNNLEKNYLNQRQEVERLENVSTKTRVVKDFLSSRLVSLEVIRALYDLLPEEIYLQNLTANERGDIEIKGTSESMSRVFSLVTALEESALFKSVKTKSTAAKKEQGRDVAAFEITFRLESSPDDKPEKMNPASDKNNKEEARESP